jgi:hypothetical protein
MDGAENACENGKQGDAWQTSHGLWFGESYASHVYFVVLEINEPSPPQSSNQLSNTGDTLEHLRKAHLGFKCGFKFLLYKKSGILLNSGPLPNSDAKGWGPFVGRGM